MKTKLSERARKKESTGIQNEARKKEIDALKKRVGWLEMKVYGLHVLFGKYCIKKVK